ncbi:extracellular solute-binding protein [Eubacteriales bacterium mix99]
MSKKTGKRIMAFALAAVIGTVFLSACGGGGKDSSSRKTGQESSASADGKRDPLVLNITMEGNPGSKDGRVNEEFEKQMSKKLNRELKIKYELIPGSEYSDKASILFSTGDFGDLIGIPFLFDYSKASEEGFLLDIAPYKDIFPNYWKYMEQTNAGIASVTDDEGHIYDVKSIGLPRFPEDKGMLPSNLSTYRYDIFEKSNIKIPETLDELYDAAKKLKEIYPDVYPVHTRWNDLRSLFFANHTSNGVYWNGKEYVMGLYEEGYRDAVAFARKLYAEGLLDPEYISDDDEMLKSKELSDKTFIVMADWFTTPGEFTRLSSSGQVFCATLFPNNPKYGEEAWQEVQPVNTVSINQFSGMAVNADTKDPEGVIEFLNHCFDDDIIRLLTWGIEGDSYNLDKDGNPQFVDDILNAPDPWSEADKYGMRASKNMSPGVILADDTKAYVALAADDWLYYDGKVHQEPIEQSEYYLNLPYPDYPENPYVPPAFEEPVCTFDTNTTQENSQITTAYNTLRDEWETAMVSGTRSMDEWDKYMKEIKNVADIDKLLDNYNKAAKEYFKRSEK